MAKLYEMCNEIDSKSLLEEREKLTTAEKRKLLDNMKHAGIDMERKKKRPGRTAGWAVAAAVMVLIIVPNISAEAAQVMGQIPILGSVIRAVTVRDYHYESERFSADIRKVQLEQSGEQASENTDKAQGTADESIAEKAGESVSEKNGESISEKTGESIAVINESIDEMTERLIARFEEQVEMGESYGGIYVDSEVVTDTDKWFTLKIDVAEVAGSGTQYQYYYHIDKTTGEIASLKDIFKEGVDYVTPVSENIIAQMKDAMAEDDMKFYWVDPEGEIGFCFEKIKEDQNFYLNGAGQIVICFDEYEVAPGYMGLVEFAVEEEAVAEIRK